MKHPAGRFAPPPSAMRGGSTQWPGQVRSTGAPKALLRSPAGLCVAAFFAMCSLAAQAQSVLLTGSIGNRAILVIDGGAPRTLAPGQTAQGVKLISMQGDQAVVEAAGQRSTLRMDSVVSIGGSGGSGGSGSRIVLTADSRGHFLTPGTINGRTVNFMLDTGATTIALSIADAQRIGLDASKGQQVQVRTANGNTSGYRLRLNSVRVGDVEVFDVEAIVSQQPMPYVLLGNSFINRFSMRRDAEQMVLERRF